ANAQELARAIERLGKIGSSVGNGHALDPAAPVRQRIRLQNPDGTPRANQSVTVLAFATSIGHCARTTGFGPIDLKTDDTGIASFRAPIGKEFLVVEHFDEKTDEKRNGEDLDPGTDHTIRARWEKKPERDFVLRIRQEDGTPAKAEVFADGDGCDVSGRSFGKTNAKGEVF